MKKMFLSIKDVLNIKRWQSTQDAISASTGLAIITVDYKGVAINEHSGCQEFCNKIREDETMRLQCQKCDSRGGLEAVRANGAYIYRCHFDIVDIAIPIIVADKYLGAVMAGQVRFRNDDKNMYLEKIAHSHDDELTKYFLETYRESYDKIPIYEYETVRLHTEMIEEICGYIVEEAVEYNYEILAKQSIKQSFKKDNMLEVIELERNDKIINHEIPKAKNSRLQSVFDYIYTNIDEQIPLSQMADLCHINENYFSRLFKKETGKSYTDYMFSLKIHWAKELLTETNMTVFEISNMLGFSESGYFSKRFKKHEGVTPTEYRKYFYKE